MSGTKHDQDKPRMELLSTSALRSIAEVMTFGAKKYDAHNWRKGFDWSRLYGAALRHLTAHMDGEDFDIESGLSHLAHAGCCLMFLLEHEAKQLGTDDRYKPESIEQTAIYFNKFKQQITKAEYDRYLELGLPVTKQLTDIDGCGMLDDKGCGGGCSCNKKES